MTQRSITFGTRVTIVLLSVLPGLILSLLLALTLAAGSNQANLYALNRLSSLIPEITISNIQGNLADQLSMDFAYQIDGMNLELQGLKLKLDKSCLWQLSLCLADTNISRLLLELSSNPNDTSDGPIELPTLKTPVYLYLVQLDIQQFLLSYNQSTILEESNIETSIDWVHHRLRIRNLASENSFCNWTGNGQIRFRDQYPLTASLVCESKIMGLKRIEAKANGDLELLDVEGKLQALLPELTQQQLPIEFKAQLLPLSPNTEFSFATTLAQPISLSLQQQATIERLKLTGKGNSSAIRLEAELAADTELLAQPLQIKFEADSNYQRLSVASFNVKSKGIDITTHGELQFSNGIQWQGKTDIAQLEISQLNENISGSVGGSLAHQLTAAGENMIADLSLDQLTGQLDKHSWFAKGKLSWNKDKLILNKINLSQHSNTISADGFWIPSENSDLQIVADIGQLEPFLAGLSGQAKADFRLTGDLNAPNVVGNLRANNLLKDSVTVENISANINWKSQQTSINKITAKLTNLNYNKQAAANLTLSLQGSPSSHQINLRAVDLTENKLDLACKGVINQQQWHAECPQLDLTLQQPNHTEYNADPSQPRPIWMQWSLQQPLSIQAELDPQFKVEPFCLQETSAKLCLDAPFQISNNSLGNLNLVASGLELDWLQPWLPKHTKFSGTLGASVAISNQMTSVQASVNGQQVTLGVNQQNPPRLDIPFEQFQAALNYNQGNADLSWQLNSSVVGSSQLNLKLAQGQKQMDASIGFSDFQIQPFTQLILESNEDSISGTLKGQLNIKGQLDTPEISGSMQLTNGKLDYSELPETVDNINLSLKAKANQKIDIEGQFAVLKQTGRITGILDWQEQWSAELNLQANKLLYEPDHGVSLQFSPKIHTKITADNVKIKGDIFVPKARVHLRTLPEQAITASSDAVITGQDANQSNTPSIDANISVKLGDDVRFRGFGLDTMLTGQLQAIQKTGTPLKSSGIIQLEKGSYQVYGQTLLISDGDLVFIDDIENPLLRLSARRERVADNVVVGVKVSGRAQQPELSFFSIPEMTQQEKLHYLITGRAPNSDPSEGSSNLAAEAALAMALESSSGKYAQKAGDLLGIQDVTVSTGTTEDRSEVGISGYVTPDLMIRYGVGMFEAVNTLTLNYRISKNLYFEVISGKSNAFDFLWSFDRD